MRLRTSTTCQCIELGAKGYLYETRLIQDTLETAASKFGGRSNKQTSIIFNLILVAHLPNAGTNNFRMARPYSCSCGLLTNRMEVHSRRRILHLEFRTYVGCTSMNCLKRRDINHENWWLLRQRLVKNRFSIDRPVFGRCCEGTTQQAILELAGEKSAWK